jgi:lysophospholipase L1-like esterase
MRLHDQFGLVIETNSNVLKLQNSHLTGKTEEMKSNDGNKFRVAIMVGTLVFFYVLSAVADTLITPDNPAINYYGRFDYSNPKALRFNWSGTTIEFLVSGTTSVGLELTDGAGYFDIEVDGKALSSPLFAGSYSSKRYDCIMGLSTGDHVIRIIRRNEPYWVIATFSGIYLTNGAKLKPLAKPVRKMEFCGDSFTAGYFIEACDDQQAKTNVNKSWARLTSKAFKAQDIILAESGIGLTKSLGGKSSFPKKYPGALDTMGGASTPVWNFSSWIPDIVTIFLGINDNSSGVNDNDYTTTLHSFVSTIRSNYPTTPILFISYTGSKDQATKAAVAAETTSLGHKNIHFLECKQAINGCSWHPTVTDAKGISDSVVAKVKQIMGWDTVSVSVVKKEVRNTVHQVSKIKASYIGRKTVEITTDKLSPENLVRIVSADGRCVAQLRSDFSGVCKWNTSRVSEGTYFISSRSTGSTFIFINK